MINKRSFIVLGMVFLIVVIFCGCAQGAGTIPLEKDELDISGTYYGYEIYTTPNTNTTDSPDTVTFPWTWTITRTGVETYTIHFYHPATEAVGSIKAMPEYDLSVNNIKLVSNSYIGLANYIQLHFEEKDGLMMAQGHFNMIKSTGETDVRVIVLTRISK